MNRTSYNSSASARQVKPSAKQLGCLPIAADDETSRISSAGQGREEREPGNSCSSRPLNHGCADLVHELANTTTAVLMNAQLLGWKLPPYSHLKRPLREIERNAQRGSELMKRLLRQLGTEGTDQANEEWRGLNPGVNQARLGANPGANPNKDTPGVEGCRSELSDAVTAQGPGVDSPSVENLLPRTNCRPAPVFSAAPADESQS